MTSKKLVMCGCAEVGWFLLKDLLKLGFSFDYFVSLTPEQAKKYQVSGYRDFTDLAASHQIPIYYPETYSLKSERDLAFFKEHEFDLLIQGGWQRLFPQSILETLSVGAIGVHGSPDYLPKGRGRSPLNWSLIEDKKRFILQLFLIQAGVDDGPVFDSEAFDITPFDTIKTLYYKNKILTKRMLERSLPALLDGSMQFYPQEGIPSYYPKRKPEDGQIDWETMDLWQIYNFIRAQTKPYPGAFALLNNKYFKLWKATIFDTRITYPKAAYGEIVERFDDQLIINCRGGLLLVEEYEMFTLES